MHVNKICFAIFITALTYFASGHGKSDFDIFLFAQEWPQSICDQTSHTKQCKIDQDVTTWTIHGLWPSYQHSPGPTFCNNSAEFNLTVLNPVLPQLKKYWANLFKRTKLGQLWAHEWMKHGTCASQLPQMNSEWQYFSSALKLNSQFNLTKIFSDHGVIPTDKDVYKYAQILNVTKQLGNAVLKCYCDKKTDKQYLSEVNICLSLKLELLDCDQYFSSQNSQQCDDNKPITYPVLKHH